MATKAPSWLDSVIGVPSVGIRMPKNWRVSFRYHDIMVPLLDSWDNSGIGFVVKQSPQGGMSIETVDGITVRLLSDTAVVEFKYTYEAEPFKPTERLTPRPYSELLKATADTMVDVVETMASRALLSIDRFGVVATTQMSPDSAPPGAQKLLRHYESAWSGSLRKVDASVLVSIDKDGSTQCHHRLALDRTTPSSPNLELTLDWQRLYAGGQKFNATTFKRLVEQCTSDAVDYFQRVGEGDF